MHEVPEITDAHDALDVLREGFQVWLEAPRSRFLTFAVANAAWSIADWVFWDDKLLNKNTRIWLAGKYPRFRESKTGKIRESGFREYVRDKSQALAICYHITTCHKHAANTRRPPLFPRISSTPMRVSKGITGIPGRSPVGRTVVGRTMATKTTYIRLQDGTEFPASSVFQTAITFWEIWLSQGRPQNGW